MKVVTIVGARPQFIKASVVSKAFINRGGIDEIIVHTGQHYDKNMSDTFFDQLDIPECKYSLGIGSGSHGKQTGRMLEAIEEVLLHERPDWALVYGDTNSTMAGALAAVKLHIPVAHVEAGLRSFNRKMPEEVNRVLTDHISEVLFTPTNAAVCNLRDEGIANGNVCNVGDVMYDAAIYYGEKAEQESCILANLGLIDKKYILATIHRAENTDDTDRLQYTMEGLAEVAKDVPVILPLHPRTRGALLRDNTFDRMSQIITFIEPIGYLDMVMLEKNACLIATDSGGVQKESFFHKIPCVTLRDETEWMELVEHEWNRLTPPLSIEVVRDGLLSAIDTQGKDIQPYGRGDASQRIASFLATGDV